MIPANEEKEYKLTGHDVMLIYSAIADKIRKGCSWQKEESDYRNILNKLGYSGDEL